MAASAGAVSGLPCSGPRVRVAGRRTARTRTVQTPAVETRTVPTDTASANMILANTDLTNATLTGAFRTRTVRTHPPVSRLPRALLEFVRGKRDSRAHPGRDCGVKHKQRSGQHAQLDVLDPAEVEVRTAACETLRPAARRRAVWGVELGLPGGYAQHRGESELGHPPLVVLGVSACSVNQRP
ncbi:MAG TPA: hypothetical protein VGS97_17385 [Actinocrinis sp.]|uniref:hypothetical protein n=1 Tax=Actinocrinis sp. TaxID=1920516 RepID=UPI002DDCFA38|nr:hypothetical protein [Actinocrinis sp.]HEV2345875.1 hypothetical protein [Actinocrinis sp.]